MLSDIDLEYNHGTCSDPLKAAPGHTHECWYCGASIPCPLPATCREGDEYACDPCAGKFNGPQPPAMAGKETS